MVMLAIKKPSKTYEAWKNMISRCEYEKHPSYKYYGAKGVTVCGGCHDFQTFLKDMGETPLNHLLDRINPFGDYEPSNCRWQHKDEKMTNTRYQHFLKQQRELNQ